MKKYLLLFVLLWAVVGVQAQQKEISYIETTKNWYYIYDESGKKIKTLYRDGIGDIKGWVKWSQCRAAHSPAALGLGSIFGTRMVRKSIPEVQIK